ncbi:MULTISPECIES: class I adenylate-forming enzyme family protein [Priestia]|uniref:class I adenylate-forming enzyme family protein n=1 Tax=Priestia TaxID=2800373 RepID=UPI002877DC4D|nr:class I adenylate-forming enzyme family protein [Priestia megaterium]MEB4886631.1 class I adenylate-forming enzyme family protein [Priestia megaterium]MED5118111.1 class I adenylate-forming enzyme family protein [Priestia megaterium]
MNRIEELVFNQCQQTPDRLALSDSVNKLSYGQMWDHVCKAENQLKEKGMEKGELVALSMPNNAEAVVSFLAILKAGGIVMLLHNELTEAEVDTYFSIQSPNWLWKTSSLTNITKEKPILPIRQVNALSDLFLFGFTSGSTGRPKGFVKSHHSWSSSFQEWSDVFSLQKHEKVLIPLHISYSAQLYPVLHALCTGMHAIMLEAFTPSAVFNKEASCMSITPALISPLLRYIQSRPKEKRLLPQTVISVGNKLSPSVRKKFSQVFPNSSLYEYYGSSEMGFVTVLSPDTAETLPHTVGYPVDSVDVLILNERGKEVEKGDKGILFVKTTQAFEGFVKDSEETNRSFFNGYVTSHDIAVQLPDGNITIVGRDKNVIKSSGSLVYAEEIEELLLQIPGVSEAAVFSIVDAERSEVVGAAIVLENISLSEVRQALTQRVSAYKIPRVWRVLTSFPRMKNGKIDKATIYSYFAEKEGKTYDFI